MDNETLEGFGIVPTSKAKIFAYVEPELKEKLERLAERRNRSVSNLLETLIREEVEQAERTGEIK
ncbi:ribbon-helix-helix protein, CopG family [Leptolyngbya sp. FACHB-711]|uniref:ribbon-helix-helix protein, CopG family n=1 Tax=Leptolyngbya sp. FACHB-711 TaxID=2692813 RepID=UPI001689E554|nr:ribbon-helix-helix protein, CopG family [Leptolyngbya sp. FACHB-711]MBD2023805.1 ribbon-helix-helix protein, CopG family [Leptolyngbya sp. FACHB-711]